MFGVTLVMLGNRDNLYMNKVLIKKSNVRQGIITGYQSIYTVNRRLRNVGLLEDIDGVDNKGSSCHRNMHEFIYEHYYCHGILHGRLIIRCILLGEGEEWLCM